MQRRDFLKNSLGALAGFQIGLPKLVTEDVWQPNYSICSEIFEGWSLEKTAPVISEIGYRGLEIAPFWLADHVDKISPARRREIRRVLSDHGVACSGLHWLLVTPDWLHITTPDNETRNRSWNYFLKLIDLCGDLEGDIMVLGSPKQRTSRGIPAAKAVDHLVEGLARIAPQAQARGVVVCMEPIGKSQNCDVVNTMAEAADVVRRVGHPNIQGMFDVHNTPDETEPLDRLIKKHASIIRHIHINEMDGSYPGTRGLDFKPVFRALKEIRYKGWTSLEVFDFTPGAEKIARESLDFMKKTVAAVLANRKAQA